MKVSVPPDELRRLAKAAQERSSYRGDEYDQLRDFVVRVNRRRVNGSLDLTSLEARQIEVMRQAFGTRVQVAANGAQRN